MQPFPFQLKYVLKKTIPGQQSFSGRLSDAGVGVIDDYHTRMLNMFHGLAPSPSGNLTYAQLQEHAQAIKNLEDTRSLDGFPSAFVIMKTPLWELMRQVKGSGAKRQAYEEMLRENHSALVTNYLEAYAKGNLPENAPLLPGKHDPVRAYHAFINGEVKNPQEFTPYRTPIVFFHEQALKDLHNHLERGNAEALPPQTGDGPPLPTYADIDENLNPTDRRKRYAVPLETAVTLIGRRHIDPETGCIASEIVHAIPATNFDHRTSSTSTRQHSPYELDQIISLLKDDPTLGIIGDVHTHPAIGIGRPSPNDIKNWQKRAILGHSRRADPFAIQGIFTSPSQRISSGFDINKLRRIEGLGPVSQQDFMDPQDFLTYLEANGSIFENGGNISPVSTLRPRVTARNDLIGDNLELFAGHLQPVGTHSLTTRFFEDRPTYRYAQSVQVIGEKPVRTNFQSSTRNFETSADNNYDPSRTTHVEGIKGISPQIDSAPWDQIDSTITNSDIDTGFGREGEPPSIMRPSPTIIRKKDNKEAPKRLQFRYDPEKSQKRASRMVSYRHASGPTSQS